MSHSVCLGTATRRTTGWSIGRLCLPLSSPNTRSAAGRPYPTSRWPTQSPSVSHQTLKPRCHVLAASCGCSPRSCSPLPVLTAAAAVIRLGPPPLPGTSFTSYLSWTSPPYCRREARSTSTLCSRSVTAPTPSRCPPCGRTAQPRGTAGDSTGGTVASIAPRVQDWGGGCGGNLRQSSGGDTVLSS